jgi:hypothetical protein
MRVAAADDQIGPVRRLHDARSRSRWLVEDIEQTQRLVGIA